MIRARSCIMWLCSPGGKVRILSASLWQWLLCAGLRENNANPVRTRATHCTVFPALICGPYFCGLFCFIGSEHAWVLRAFHSGHDSGADTGVGLENFKVCNITRLLDNPLYLLRYSRPYMTWKSCMAPFTELVFNEWIGVCVCVCGRGRESVRLWLLRCALTDVDQSRGESLAEKLSSGSKCTVQLTPHDYTMNKLCSSSIHKQNLC